MARDEAMVTCEERRRVAEGLRAAKGPSLMVLMGVLGVGGEGAFDRLADLIEPPACPARAVRAYAEEVDWNTGESPLVHELRRLADRMERECAPVDRDALLALAAEMEIDGAGALDDGDWCKPLLVEYARRIREALGVVA